MAVIFAELSISVLVELLRLGGPKFIGSAEGVEVVGILGSRISELNDDQNVTLQAANVLLRSGRF